MGIGVSIVSSISKVSISSIQKVGVSISLGLRFSISRSLANIAMGIGVSIVSRISKMSQAISVSSVQKVGISISLGLGLRLSNGNSSQKSLEENKSNHNSVQTMRGESSGEISQLTMANVFIILMFLP